MNNDSALKDNLKDLFDQFDEDGGGEIDASELGKVMERLGQHCTEAELHVRTICSGEWRELLSTAAHTGRCRIWLVKWT